VVGAGVANNDETGFQELLGILIGKCTWDPFSTEVVSTSVGAELENGALGVRS